VDNLDRPNTRDPSATARRERAYKFGQAQRARPVSHCPPREDLVEYLLDGGAAEKQIDHWIQKCLERADISQPEEGMYRR